MFLTDPDVRQSVAGLLKQDAATLAGYWDRLIQECHASAYYDVRGALLQRGFTVAQVDGWDRGAEFERDLTLYWCMVRGGLHVHAISAEQLDRLDRRKELETVLVETAAAPQPPAHDPGRITHGVLATTYTDAAGADREDRWTRDTRL